jgi:hypothetical protein
VVPTGGLAITSGFPVPTRVPPHVPEYQFNITPLPPVAVRVSGVNVHRFEALGVTAVGATGTLYTVMVIEAHPEAPQLLFQLAQ